MNFSYLFSLPLLTKELIEQAQHQRTYVLRVIYAVVLYSLAIWQYNSTVGGGLSGFANLGRGREFFVQLVFGQIWAILFLLPAITCGALTVEKEKDTLALLLLTKLKPWTIVFEKLLSRIFAMATYQLLSLPLFGIVQSMGGVEVWEIIAANLCLMSLTILVGSISILCSTWFRTTSEAFIMSYLSVACASCVYAPIFISFAENPWLFVSSGSTVAPQTFSQQVLSLIGILAIPMVIGTFSLLVSGFILVVASKVLVPRAFVPSWNIVLVLFQHADRFFNELNAKTTGGIVLVPDRETLPLFKPIAWRETRKKSLGTFRYQFRVLMLLLAPLILVIAAVMTDARTEFNSPFKAFPIFFWFVSVICLTIHSTGVLPAERIRQTLDVLLVAPLSAAEIVSEKLAGVRRLIKVLSTPFAVLIFFQALWTGFVRQDTWRTGPTNLWYDLLSTSLSVIVYMPLIMWIGFQFGLRMRTQIQAVLCTFAAVVGTCVIPLILSVVTAEFFRDTSLDLFPFLDDVKIIIDSLSPLAVLFGMGNYYDPRFGGTRLAIHFTFFTLCWYFLRRNAIRSFSKIVRRLEPSNHAEPEISTKPVIG